MRIGIYLENYVAGGVDTVIVNKINSWPITSDEIILFCNKTHDGLERIIKPRLKRQCIIVETKILSRDNVYRRFKGQPHFLVRIIMVYFRHLFSIINYYRIKKYLNNYDLNYLFIHNGGYPGALSAIVAVAAARAVGIHGVTTVIHNLPVKYTFKNFVFDLVYDVLLNKSSNIVCVSNESMSQLLEFRRVSRPVYVIHNGIEPLSICNKNCQLSRLKKEVINILMVGCFDERKGHQVLIEAITELKKYLPNLRLHVHVAGKGSDTEKHNLLNKINNLYLSEYFSFLGFIDNIGEVMSKMDILVFPSVAYESFPITILEAMSAGLAIVASNVGGISEMLEDKRTGLLVPPADAYALASALLHLLKEPELIITLGKAARESFYINYTADKMAIRYQELIKVQ